MPQFAYNPVHKNNLDPNSMSGYVAERLVLNISRVDQIWIDSTCMKSNVTFSERKSDKKSQFSRANMLLNNEGWLKILKQKPTCIMLIGYWLNPQWISPFLPEIKKYFSKALARLPRYNLSDKDIVVHIRCAEPHYVFLPRSYYDNILRNITYNRIFLAASSTCRKKENVRDLISSYNFSSFPELEANHYFKNLPIQRESEFLKDFSLLVSAKRLILSSSTFSDWGGLLSQAFEIHSPFFSKPGGTVSQNWSPVWQSDTRYIYHDPYSLKFFGKFDKISNSILFMKNMNTVNISLLY